jgi:ketosteroid isomerase-like protein
LILPGDINHDAVVAEVRACFDEYEAALRRHDADALNRFFLQRADTVRFGLAEHNYGAAAIDAWRRDATPVSAQRRITRLVIVTLGHDSASVSAEFEAPDSAGIGRQTQHWVRMPEGWRIAAAHVSRIERAALR